MRIATFVLGLALAGGPVFAQDDEMAMQNCIRTCLDNDDPAISECLMRHCVYLKLKPKKIVGWRSGFINGDTGRYAGTNTADDRYGLYFICDRAGRTELNIAGVNGPAGAWALVIDGETYAFTFVPWTSGVSTVIARDDAVLSALMRGSTVALSGPGLPDTETSMSLQGASLMLAMAMKGCL